MALKNVKLNGGTTDNPVVLSAKQINGLVALYNDETVTKDISGVVKAYSGKMRTSEYKAIENLGFTIVETTTIADEFSLYAANNEPLFEGKSVQLYSTGIAINNLVLNIVQHEIIINSGIISEDIIKNRIHISNTGLITVDDAEENATWQDVITIQAYPSFDPNNKVLIRNPITVKGIAMSGISVTSANSVLIGNKVNVEVNTLPSNNTKNNYRIELSASNGVINNNVYNAPDTPVEASLIAECFLFGGNIADFHVEKTISVKQPTIICEIKDKDGEEVEGAYISVTDGTTNYVTQLHNGETMTAVLNRTYNIEAFVPEGYTKVVVPENITPKEVETIITAIYYPIQVGVIAVFEDGSYISYDEWTASGFPDNINGNNLIAAGYIESDGTGYCFANNSYNENVYWSKNNQEFEDAKIENAEDTLLVNVERAKYLTSLISSLYTDKSEINNCSALYCVNKHITINNEERNGWLPSCRQLMNIYNNYIPIKNILKKLNIDIPSLYWQSCNYKEKPIFWYLSDGIPQANYRGEGVNNYFYNGSYFDNTGILVIPFFDL